MGKVKEKELIFSEKIIDHNRFAKQITYVKKRVSRVYEKNDACSGIVYFHSLEKDLYVVDPNQTNKTGNRAITYLIDTKNDSFVRELLIAKGLVLEKDFSIRDYNDLEDGVRKIQSDPKIYRVVFGNKRDMWIILKKENFRLKKSDLPKFDYIISRRYLKENKFPETVLVLMCSEDHILKVILGENCDAELIEIKKFIAAFFMFMRSIRLNQSQKKKLSCFEKKFVLKNGKTVDLEDIERYLISYQGDEIKKNILEYFITQNKEDGIFCEGFQYNGEFISLFELKKMLNDLIGKPVRVSSFDRLRYNDADSLLIASDLDKEQAEKTDSFKKPPEIKIQKNAKKM